MNNVTIRLWDIEKFSSAQHEWNSLLENSCADQLFLSWEWQYTWWQIFAIPEQMQLRLYVAFNKDNQIIGIAPLYISEITTAKFIRIRRLEFIGNCWRGRTTMLTELLEFITGHDRRNEVVHAFIEHIQKSTEWDEFVIAGLRTDSPTYQATTISNTFTNCYLRHAEQYPSYILSTNSDFNAYLNLLGKNTRLRLFNRRKLLESLGKITFTAYKNNIDNNFELLNRLHSMRWGKPVFTGQRLEFNKSVALLLAARDGLRFSILYINDKPISIQYNYHINKHLYNIQAGFDPAIHEKLAPGYLHFGYAIEWAFKDDTNFYDFLAGDGKNTSYKENLTKSKLDIVELQIVRKPLLKYLYLMYDTIKSRNKSSAATR